MKDNLLKKGFTKQDSLIAKGFGILLLLFYHLFYEKTVLEEFQVNFAPFSKEHFLMLAGFGNICVSVFVMITAYGIAKSILDTEEMNLGLAYKQAVRRFVKLMSGFGILYVSVCLIWFQKFDLVSLYGTGKQGLLLLLCDALGLAHFLGTPMLNLTWWYMSLAYTLIFLVPVLTFCVKKVGNALLPLVFFLPMAVTLNSDMERYLFVAALGVCGAYGKWFDKVMAYRIHAFLKWGIGIAGFILCLLIRQNAVVKDYFVQYVDAPIAFFLICFSVMLFGQIPGVKQMLTVLGKYSMNIYLVHTFFYMILFREFIYSFRYGAVIFAMLVIVSLLYGVFVELVKKAAAKGIRMAWGRLTVKTKFW